MAQTEGKGEGGVGLSQTPGWSFLLRSRCVQINCGATTVEAGRVVVADCDIPTGSNGLTVEDTDGFVPAAGRGRPDGLMDSAKPVRTAAARVTCGFTR